MVGDDTFNSYQTFCKDVNPRGVGTIFPPLNLGGVYFVLDIPSFFWYGGGE